MYVRLYTVYLYVYEYNLYMYTLYNVFYIRS